MRILAYFNLHGYGDLAVDRATFIELNKQYDIVINESADAELLSATVYGTELIANTEELLQKIRGLLDLGSVVHKVINVNEYTDKPHVVGLRVFACCQDILSALETLGGEITRQHGTTWRGAEPPRSDWWVI